jgi:hypothetical protein
MDLFRTAGHFEGSTGIQLLNGNGPVGWTVNNELPSYAVLNSMI